MEPKETVLAFWESMRTNDYHAASQWLSEDFECLWPQSSEVIVGRENFAREINTRYPSNGVWRFHLNSSVAEGSEVVTDVSITDGVQKARAITFHTVENGLIRKQVELWPDDYEAPAWRAQWVHRLTE